MHCWILYCNLNIAYRIINRNCILNSLYVVSPVKIKKQERSFGNLPTLIFLDNEHVHPVRSMDSPKFFLSNVGHNTLFLKVANSDVKDN